MIQKSTATGMKLQLPDSTTVYCRFQMVMRMIIQLLRRNLWTQMSDSHDTMMIEGREWEPVRADTSLIAAWGTRTFFYSIMLWIDSEPLKASRVCNVNGTRADDKL